MIRYLITAIRLALPWEWHRHAVALAAENRRVRIDRAEARRLVIEAREMLTAAEAIEGQDQYEQALRDWLARSVRWLA